MQRPWGDQNGKSRGGGGTVGGPDGQEAGAGPCGWEALCSLWNMPAGFEQKSDVI